MAQHLVPPHHGAADDVMENGGIHAGLVGIQFQRAAHVPQPRPGVQIPEPEGYLLAGDDLQILNKVDTGQFPQRGLVGGVAGAPLALYGVAAHHGQGRDLAVFRGGDPLDIGDDIGPVPAELEEAVEKRVEVRKILGQDLIVHPSGQQRAASHEEKVLDGIGQAAGQLVGKGRAGDVVKAVFLPGVGEGRHALFRREHPCREQGRIAAAGDVDGAVRVLLSDGKQLPQDAVRLEPAGLHEDQLRFPAPPLEEGGQGLLPGAVLGNLTGAEVDDALRTEHIRRQNIFNGSLIIQFDQGVHVPSAFLCFSPLYCVPAENTIDNPPGLSEKDVESRKNQHRRSGAG